MDSRNEIEFDLMQMVRYLLKKIWIILLAIVVFAGGGFYISKSTTVPQYTTHCRVYVYQKDEINEDESVDYNGVVLATQLANDCEILITGINVTERVVENLGLNVSPDYISDRIVVTSQSNTRILEIEYTDSNPERAAAILNEICDEGSKQIVEIMNVDAVNKIYSARVPASANPTNEGRDAILAGAVGALLAIGVLVVLFLMDDTIRNEDDVERYLGLSTLSALPAAEELGGQTETTAKGKQTARFAKK